MGQYLVAAKAAARLRTKQPPSDESTSRVGDSYESPLPPAKDNRCFHQANGPQHRSSPTCTAAPPPLSLRLLSTRDLGPTHRALARPQSGGQLGRMWSPNAPPPGLGKVARIAEASSETLRLNVNNDVNRRCAPTAERVGRSSLNSVCLPRAEPSQRLAQYPQESQSGTNGPRFFQDFHVFIHPWPLPPGNPPSRDKSNPGFKHPLQWQADGLRIAHIHELSKAVDFGYKKNWKARASLPTALTWTLLQPLHNARFHGLCLRISSSNVPAREPVSSTRRFRERSWVRQAPHTDQATQVSPWFKAVTSPRVPVTACL